MTKLEAIRLLRNEQLGDSELMEAAKQMGANALERMHTGFVTPKCEKCGRYILGIAITTVPEISRGSLLITSNFHPAQCPTCHTPFVSADLDYEEQTCILKGPKEAAENDE